jgi:hypothetical protein
MLTDNEELLLNLHRGESSQPQPEKAFPETGNKKSGL